MVFRSADRLKFNGYFVLGLVDSTSTTPSLITLAGSTGVSKVITKVALIGISGTLTPLVRVVPLAVVDTTFGVEVSKMLGPVVKLKEYDPAMVLPATSCTPVALRV